MGRRIVLVKMSVATCPDLRPFSSYCTPQPAKNFDVALLSYCMTWRRVIIIARIVYIYRLCVYILHYENPFLTGNCSVHKL